MISHSSKRALTLVNSVAYWDYQGFRLSLSFGMLTVIRPVFHGCKIAATVLVIILSKTSNRRKGSIESLSLFLGMRKPFSEASASFTSVLLARNASHTNVYINHWWGSGSLSLAWTDGSSQGLILSSPTRGHWQCLQTYLIVRTGEGC